MANVEDNLIKLVEGFFNLTDKEHREILKLYKQSNDNISQFIANLYIQYGNDGILEMSELQKYNRMQKVEEFLKWEAKTLASAEVIALGSLLSTVYTSTFYKTAYTLEKSLNVGISFNLLNPTFVKEAINFNWSGVPFSERVWVNADALVKSLRTELTQSIIQGESIDKLARRIRKQFDSKAYQSQRLARTESARIISSAQEKIYAESGVVHELIFTATLDSKTSDTCKKNDSKRWKVDDPNKPKIPTHPNCRSCWIAAVKDYQPKKRKDNETDEIIQHMSYEEWEKKKGIKK
jgi:SPP1 gp7 family putative phage head morphogenesis protein